MSFDWCSILILIILDCRTLKFLEVKCNHHTIKNFTVGHCPKSGHFLGDHLSRGRNDTRVNSQQHMTVNNPQHVTNLERRNDTWQTTVQQQHLILLILKGVIPPPPLKWQSTVNNLHLRSTRAQESECVARNSP